MARLCSSLLLSLLIASSASAVTVDWTPIGSPGNACDPRASTTGHPGGCFGGVSYGYYIGTYEVTNEQYTEFLNAKATNADPLGLYNVQMETAGPTSLGGIVRTESGGNYTYTVISGRGDMPVNWVSVFDAMRFANWMNNGQGSGETETGAYTLLGGTPIPSNAATVTRNPGASIVLTSENEWYKSAYYNAATASYFSYPAGFEAPTICSGPTADPNHANCSSYPSGDVTEAGIYTGSPSPSGTFDQGGNVLEWSETSLIDPLSGLEHVIRGGVLIATQRRSQHLGAAPRTRQVLNRWDCASR
jgi:formylglycine-generating enzyme required for sulfatase activity